MSFPAAFKRFKTNQGETVQGDPDSESNGANTKRKVLRKRLHLVDLNEDCLHEICKRMSVLDLALLAQTYKKLKGVATEVFAEGNKVCDFKEVKDFVMADRLLRTFGSSILYLNIDFTQYAFDGGQIIDSILQNCWKLQSLKMESYEIPDCPIAFAKIRQLFGKLKSLHIVLFSIEGCQEWDDHNPTVTPNGHVVNFFRDCSSLVNLKIDWCYALERAIFKSNLPKLQHLQYVDDISPHHIVKGVRGFAFRHQNLKTLIVDAPIKTSGTIEMISANCTKLQELEFIASTSNSLTTICDTALRQLGTLQNLSRLKIEWNEESVVRLLQEFRRSTSLKVLELTSIKGSPNLITIISQIKTLCVLKLIGTINLKNQNLNDLLVLVQLSELYIERQQLRHFNFDLLAIIEHLVNLKKFKFDVYDMTNHHFFRICGNHYLHLVDAVQSRPVGKSPYLEIECYTTGDFKDLLCPTVEIKTL